MAPPTEENGTDRVIAGQPDFYEVLGVQKTSSKDEIRKAFRVKAKGLHPDKGGDRLSYNLVHRAYEVLSDVKLREHYDATGRTEKSAEEEFLEKFGNRGSSQHRDTNTEALDFSQRLVRPKDSSHASGFDEWLRSRDLSKSTIDDDYIRTSLGVSKAAYETVPHMCKHPTTKLLRKALPLKSVQNAKPDEFVQVAEQRLRKELEWGEALVNLMFAPVNPYDLTVLRVGEDILWSYHQQTQEKSPLLVGPGSEETPTTIEEEEESGTKGKATAADGGSAKASRGKKPRATEQLILGSEGVALVATVGPGMKELREGDWVIPLKENFGTWQTAAIWRERDLLRLPPNILPVEYVAVAKELFLAYHLLEHFGSDLKPGDGVIMNAGNSLVVQAVIQFSKLLGFRVIAVVRRHSDAEFDKMADYLYELGANRVYCEDEPIRSRILRDHAALPKLALDAVMGPTSTAKIVHTLQEGGKLVVYGGLSGNPLTLPWHLIVSHDITLQSFYLTKWLEKASNQRTMLAALENVSKLLEAKKLLVNTKEFPVSDYKGALEELRVHGRTCKPLLKLPSIQEEEMMYSNRLQVEKAQKEKAQVIVQNLFSNKKSAPPVMTNGVNGHTDMVNGGRSHATREKDLMTVTIPPEEGHKTTIIFLHNRGEVPEEYEAIFKRFITKDENLKNVKIVLPEGPVTEYEDGEELPSWCDKSYEVLFNEREQPRSALEAEDVIALQTIEHSCDLLANLAEQEMATLRPGRVVLAGFHQGAIIAMFTALTKLDVAVGGIICFGLPRLSKRTVNFLSQKSPPFAKKSKLFIMNGSHDTLAGPSITDSMKTTLLHEGFTGVSSETIPNGKHEVADEQLAHLAAVLGLIL